jgi:hypothetical protein
VTPPFFFVQYLLLHLKACFPFGFELESSICSFQNKTNLIFWVSSLSNCFWVLTILFAVFCFCFKVSYMGLSPLITCLGFYYYYYLGWLEELLFEIRFGKWSTFCTQISNKWDKYVYYFSSNVYLINTHFNI